jgi:hypothetical protein
VNYQPMLFAFVQPPGLDEGRDKLIVVAFPVDQDGDFLVAEATDIALWRLRRGAVPEQLQQPH